MKARCFKRSFALFADAHSLFLCRTFVAEGLAQNVLKMYMEYDLALYDKCTAAYFREEEDAKKRLEALASKWQEIEQAAMQQGASAIMAK